MPLVICLFGFSSSDDSPQSDDTEKKPPVALFKNLAHAASSTAEPGSFTGAKAEEPAKWEPPGRISSTPRCAISLTQWKSRSYFLGSPEHFKIYYADWEGSRCLLDSDTISSTLTNFHGPSMHFQFEVRSAIQWNRLVACSLIAFHQTFYANSNTTMNYWLFKWIPRREVKTQENEAVYTQMQIGDFASSVACCSIQVTLLLLLHAVQSVDLLLKLSIITTR